MAKIRKSKGDKEKILQDKIQGQFGKFFSGQQEPPTHMSIREVEALQAHVAELEAKLAERQPGNEQAPSFPAKETVMESLPAQPSSEIPRKEAVGPFKKLSAKDVRVDAEKPGSAEDKQKNIGLWAAGIFAVLGLAFLLFWVYNVMVLQQGQADLGEKVLFPVTIIMLVAGLAGFILIRRNHLVAGLWVIFGVVLLPPVITNLVLNNVYFVLIAYIAVFAPISITWVFPKSSRQAAFIATVAALIAITGIEVWHPAFRIASTALGNFAPFMIALGGLGLLALSVRQAIGGNIRTKMIAAFVAVALVSVAAIGIITNLVSRAELTRQAGENIHALAVVQAQEVGNVITRQIELISTLRQNPALKKAVIDANAGYIGDTAIIQAKIDQLDKVWSAADAANNNADPLVQSVLSNGVTAYLTAFQKTFPDHIEMLVTDQYGALIASTDRLSKYNHASEDWWRATYNDGIGTVYIGQPELDASTNTYAIILAVPIRDDSTGDTIGVFRTTYRLAALAQIVTNVHFGKTGVTYLIFQNNVFVGSNTLARMMDASMQAQLKSIISGGYSQIMFNGKPQIVSKVLIVSSTPWDDISQQLTWNLVTSQEETEALSPIVAQTETTLFVSLGVLLAAVVLGLLAAQYLAGPITRLTVVASQVAAGDLAVQAQVTSQDEIGILASTFNKMTAQLREIIGTMERRIAERTHDLELASEVGRAVSEKTTDLYSLLKEAVELIQQRFDLYYAQIYIPDPVGRTLVLRAGTGEVGAELLRRNHSLLISPGSLNGRAAIERRVVIVTDTKRNANFLPNPLLPNTRSEMAMPLIAGGQVVGVLDMQSDQPDALNETNLPAFEALAGQLAVAIQNAFLFAQAEQVRVQAEQARAEVEAQIRSSSEQGWREFLNAIDRGERIGFAFDQTNLIPLKADAFSMTPAEAFSMPITVTGAKIGTIQFVDQSDDSMSTKDTEIVQAIAAQLGQHIDNLRLLAQAESYRAEAEDAILRLTREGWDAYLQAHGKEATGFVYDLNEVSPLNEQENARYDSEVNQPLTVREEIIGEFSIDTADGSREAVSEIVSAVAAQLSVHIENLRLSLNNMSLLKSTEERARREQALRQITSAVRGSTDPTTIMRTAVRELGNILGRKTAIRITTAEQEQAAAIQGNISDSPAVSPKSAQLEATNENDR